MNFKDLHLASTEILDLKFEHYVGEKLHELPKEFLKTLNEDQSRAESKEFFKEKDFEITQYLSQCAGFSGILKHRSSDFVVHEISPNGEAVKLTDLSLPPDLNKVQRFVSSIGKIGKGILFFNCLGYIRRGINVIVITTDGLSWTVSQSII